MRRHGSGTPHQPGRPALCCSGVYAAASAAVRRSSTDRFHRPSSAVVAPSPRLGRRSTSDRETPSVGPRSARQRPPRPRGAGGLLTYLLTYLRKTRSDEQRPVHSFVLGRLESDRNGLVVGYVACFRRRIVERFTTAAHCIALQCSRTGECDCC